MLLLAPLLLGAADPAGDLVSCRRAARPCQRAPIDIVRASGGTAEAGLALRFRSRSRPRAGPGRGGPPLRVDVLLRDTAVPDLSVDYYRALNRIMRFDALDARPGCRSCCCPRETDSPFTSGVAVDGDTLTLTVPRAW